MKDMIHNIKKRIKRRRGALAHPLVSIILANGLLAAAFGFALAGCDGLEGMEEDITNCPSGVPIAMSTALSISMNPQDNIDYTKGSGESFLPTITATPILTGAVAGLSTDVRLEWYRSGKDPGTDVLLATKTVTPAFPGIPGTPDEYDLTLDDVNEVGQAAYYVIAIYPAAANPIVQKTSDSILVTVHDPSELTGDYDGDGYPDFWEEAHSSEGYNPYQADTPYGLDLTLKGASPPGAVVLGGNTFMVTGKPDTDGIVEYRVYNSLNDPDQVVVTNIILAAREDNHMKGKNEYNESYERHTTARIYVSPDVTSLTLTTDPTESVPGEDVNASGANLVIEKGANVTITLESVNLTGGAPIALQAGANLTLKLSGTSTLKAGVVNGTSTYDGNTRILDLACAGIQVPKGAALTIVSANNDGSGKLNVTGGSGTGAEKEWIAKIGTWGCGAGIGGGFAENAAAGDITIDNVTVIATGGYNEEDVSPEDTYNWYGAAGIGGGGAWMYAEYPNIGTVNKITIKGDSADVTATARLSGAGIGGGYGIDYVTGEDYVTINIEGGKVIASNTDGNGAGIGGGRSGGDGGIITISGGDVTATSAANGAGIGGGDGCDNGGTITISGGKVTVDNTESGGAGGRGAGIGGGAGGDGGTILIYGAQTQVTAKTLFDGAAIGGGASGNGGIITIEGGTIEATNSGQRGAGIGGGEGSSSGGGGGTITISGGTVTAAGGANAAGIGGGYSGAGGEIHINDPEKGGGDSTGTAKKGTNAYSVGPGSGGRGGTFNGSDTWPSGSDITGWTLE